MNVGWLSRASIAMEKVIDRLQAKPPGKLSSLDALGDAADRSYAYTFLYLLCMYIVYEIHGIYGMYSIFGYMPGLAWLMVV